MVRVRVIHAWQKLSQTQRKELRRRAMRAKDAGMRCRCKVVLTLVQGTTPTMIAQGGLCAKSPVYRIAERFITDGLAGLASTDPIFPTHPITWFGTTWEVAGGRSRGFPRILYVIPGRSQDDIGKGVLFSKESRSLLTSGEPARMSRSTL